jgi:hypothetical protein
MYEKLHPGFMYQGQNGVVTYMIAIVEVGNSNGDRTVKGKKIRERYALDRHWRRFLKNTIADSEIVVLHGF